MQDTFRKEYKPLSDDQKAYVELFKDKAEELQNEFYNAGLLNPNKVCMDLALQRLQESIMWAVKAIT